MPSCADRSVRRSAQLGNKKPLPGAIHEIGSAAFSGSLPVYFRAFAVTGQGARRRYLTPLLREAVGGLYELFSPSTDFSALAFYQIDERKSSAAKNRLHKRNKHGVYRRILPLLALSVYAPRHAFFVQKLSKGKKHTATIHRIFIYPSYILRRKKIGLPPLHRPIAPF